MDSMLFPKGDTAKRVLNDNSFDDHGKVFYIEKIPREDNLDTVSTYEKILIGYLTSRIRVRQIICRVVYGRIHEACV